MMSSLSSESRETVTNSEGNESNTEIPNTEIPQEFIFVRKMSQELDQHQDAPPFLMPLVTSSNNIREIEWIESNDVEKKEVIGEGYFGIVHKAIWKDQIVAVKTLKKETNSNKKVPREVEMMLKLRHPNIVDLFGYYSQPEYGLVMEFMEGGSLWHYLHCPGDIPWSRRRQIAIDMTCGLEYLHSKNVVHRDIKSLNVLLTGNFKAKLADFGYAKLKSNIQSIQTFSGNYLKGTVRWMAPEIMTNFIEDNTATQTDNNNTNLAMKSDIYSLGITFWEIVSRDIPFGNVIDLALPYLLSKGEAVQKVPEACPEEFRQIIQACINFNPDERPELYSVRNRLNLWYEPTEAEFSTKDHSVRSEPSVSINPVASVHREVLATSISTTHFDREDSGPSSVSDSSRALTGSKGINNFIVQQILSVQMKGIIVFALLYIRKDIIEIVHHYFQYITAIVVVFGGIIILCLLENDLIIDSKGLVKMSLLNPIPKEEQLNKAIILKKGLIYIRDVIDKGDFIDALLLTVRGVITHDLFPCEGKASDGTIIRVPYVSSWNLCFDEQTYSIARGTVTWAYQLGILNIQTTLLKVKAKSHFDGLDEDSMNLLHSLAPRHLNPLPDVDKIVEFFRLHPNVKLREEEWKKKIFRFVDFYISNIDMNIKKFQDAKEWHTKSEFKELVLRGFHHLIARLFKTCFLKYKQ